MRRISKVIALVSLSSMLGCSATPPDGGAAEEKSRPNLFPIVGGTPATDYPEAALIDMDGGSACSGAVIAPRVVLTAGHCVNAKSGWQVTAPYANQSASATSAMVYDYTDSSQTTNPNMHDIGIVILGSEISLASYPAIANTASPDGTEIVNIGRIQDGNFSSSDLFVSQPVGVVDGAQSGFPYDYQVLTQIIQPGDSGGPDMLAGSHTIVAVNSGSGSGQEVLARVDLLYDWIQQQIADNGGGGDPSGSTSGGSTSGGDPNDPTGGDPTDPSGGSTSGGSTSGGDPGTGECAGFTYEGDCYGPVLIWCEGGLNVANCAEYGLNCGWDEAQGYYNCLP